MAVLDGVRTGVNTIMLLQPDTKLGMFVAFAQGSPNPGIEVMQTAVIAAGLQLPALLAKIAAAKTPQPSPLPPAWSDYLGNYTDDGTGLFFTVQRVAAAYGDGVYLTASNFASPAEIPMSLQPNGIADQLLMVPAPQDLCWTVESNLQYVIAFERENPPAGAVNAATVQGQLFFNVTFTRHPL